jgi:4-amino-4-deoxy-L-arabinose transferase-like glycosyltransferase
VNANAISRTTVLKTFAALIVAAFLLRIFYAGHLFEDDGLWFTAAEELLRGKALYREIYFDKPPALPLLYALLFKLFGAHILTIRLFAALYSLAVAVVLYLFGALLYDKRLGLLAAALFVVGSTTYTTGQFQGFSTDCIMTLPYTLGAYWFVRSHLDRQLTTTKSAWLAVASGIACGIALQTNPKAIFDLLFFALCALLLARSPKSGVRSPAERSQTANNQSQVSHSETNPKSKIQNPKFQRLPAACGLLLTICGLLIGSSPFWIYIAATHSWSAYWVSVWDWGSRYAGYYSWDVSIVTALEQSLGYFLLNSIFLVGLVFVITTTMRYLWQRKRKGAKTAPVADSMSPALVHSDAVLLLWFAVSYAGMSVGGRFFGHYFMQILPALCLLASRGIYGIVAALNTESQEKRAPRNIAFTLLTIALLITLVRYHTRTVILATDWLSGTKSEATGSWFYERVQREDQNAAAIVKEGLGNVEEIEIAQSPHRESSRAQKQGSEAYLFVWGYRPEIYYWSGLRPASRYLSSQLLTGVPADVNYFGDDFTAVLDEKTTAAHRAQLLQELQEKRPKFIIDELAAYNSSLAMESYPELKDFLYDYKLMETDVKVFIYRLRNLKEKNKPASN